MAASARDATGPDGRHRGDRFRSGSATRRHRTEGPTPRRPLPQRFRDATPPDRGPTPRETASAAVPRRDATGPRADTAETASAAGSRDATPPVRRPTPRRPLPQRFRDATPPGRGPTPRETASAAVPRRAAPGPRADNRGDRFRSGSATRRHRADGRPPRGPLPQRFRDATPPGRRPTPRGPLPQRFRDAPAPGPTADTARSASAAVPRRDATGPTADTAGSASAAVSRRDAPGPTADTAGSASAAVPRRDATGPTADTAGSASATVSRRDAPGPTADTAGSASAAVPRRDATGPTADTAETASAAVPRRPRPRAEEPRWPEQRGADAVQRCRKRSHIRSRPWPAAELQSAIRALVHARAVIESDVRRVDDAALLGNLPAAAPISRRAPGARKLRKGDSETRADAASEITVDTTPIPCRIDIPRSSSSVAPNPARASPAAG